MKIEFELEEAPQPIPYTKIDAYFRDIFAPHYHKQFEKFVEAIKQAIEKDTK